MSIMTVTTQLTHKSLMAKSKRELVDLVLMYADIPDLSNLTNMLEDEVIFLRGENESLNEINKTLREERDAAIADARKLAQNWNGVMTSVELEAIVKKYLQQ